MRTSIAFLTGVVYATIAVVLLVVVARPASAPLQRPGIYALRVTYVNDLYLYNDPVACARAVSFVESNKDAGEGTRFVDCVWLGGE